jgi:hypothetical protein
MYILRVEKGGSQTEYQFYETGGRKETENSYFLKSLLRT